LTGIVESVSSPTKAVVEGVELRAYRTKLKVDRVFQGPFSSELEFTWYSLPVFSGQGMVYSGPPTTSFQAGQRYLIFLKRKKADWIVAMPLFALEVALATSTSSALRDLSASFEDVRYRELASELETTALQLPKPQPETTGFVVWYFPWVFDLIGRCAVPFYRHYGTSLNPDIRRSAANWIKLACQRKPPCGTTIPQLSWSKR
jgi:hypothetical protein